MHISIPRRLSATLAASTLCLAIGACGDDEAAASDEFCQAEIDLESAVGSEDPDAIAAAFETISAEAPEEVKDSVDTAIAEAEVFMAEDGEPTPEFTAAYAELMGFVKDECGFTDISVAATDYEFGGLDEEYEAGPAVITLENAGEELHELAIMRINDDVTESVEELLALPEEEGRTKVTEAGGAFAFPGETGYTALDLTPGRYMVACFVPKGLTPEALEELEAGGAEPEGEPHFMLGMVAEFEVS